MSKIKLSEESERRIAGEMALYCRQCADNVAKEKAVTWYGDLIKKIRIGQFIKWAVEYDKRANK